MNLYKNGRFIRRTLPSRRLSTFHAKVLEILCVIIMYFLFTDLDINHILFYTTKIQILISIIFISIIIQVSSCQISILYRYYRKQMQQCPKDTVKCIKEWNKFALFESSQKHKQLFKYP